MSILGSKQLSLFSSTCRGFSAVAATPVKGKGKGANIPPLLKRKDTKARYKGLPTTAGSTKAYKELSSNLMSTLDKLARLNPSVPKKQNKPKIIKHVNTTPTQKSLPPQMPLKGQKVLREIKPYSRSTRPREISSTPRAPAPHTEIEQVRKEQEPVLLAGTSGRLEPSTAPTLIDVEAVRKQHPVAKLVHGLERVLFNPGVHWFQDPRSGVFNFSPSVRNIPKVTDFAFEKLPPFTKSSRDMELWDLARREERRFAGSTSSLSGMLSHIYFLLSGHKPVNLESLPTFQNAPGNFTPGQRMPTSVVFNYNDGRYAVDSASDLSSEKNILTWMGTLLEKYLTTDSEEFSTFMRNGSTPEQRSDTEREMARDAFRFSKSKTFVMRSQLDCQDHRLPGTGVFDIKTRASLSIRMDLLNFETNSGYLIDTLYGLSNSFEKEYYDLIRSAFLKYSFQVRIGNMDGVFVAYHNTEHMFGFQYISLDEMDKALFGDTEGAGERVFQKCVNLMEIVSDRAVQCFPNQSVRCLFETPEPGKRLDIWVQPDQWDGPEAERPITQLIVQGVHFLDGKLAWSGRQCVNSSLPWAVDWSIGERSASRETILLDFAGSQQRKFRPFSLPDGVSMHQITDFWRNLNFSGAQVEADNSEIDENFLSNFAEPDPMIIALRQSAMLGRQITQKRAREEEGLPVFVLGEKFDEAQARAKKMALATLKSQNAALALQKTQNKGFSDYEELETWDVFGDSGEESLKVNVPRIKIGFDVVQQYDASPMKETVFKELEDLGLCHTDKMEDGDEVTMSSSAPSEITVGALEPAGPRELTSLGIDVSSVSATEAPSEPDDNISAGASTAPSAALAHGEERSNTNASEFNGDRAEGTSETHIATDPASLLLRDSSLAADIRVGVSESRGHLSRDGELTTGATDTENVVEDATLEAQVEGSQSGGVRSTPESADSSEPVNKSNRES